MTRLTTVAIGLAAMCAVGLTAQTQETQTTTKTEVENGKDQETKTKTEGTSGAFDLPFLGVRAMKTLSSSCY